MEQRSRVLASMRLQACACGSCDHVAACDTAFTCVCVCVRVCVCVCAQGATALAEELLALKASSGPMQGVRGIPIHAAVEARNAKLVNMLLNTEQVRCEPCLWYAVCWMNSVCVCTTLVDHSGEKRVRSLTHDSGMTTHGL